MLTNIRFVTSQKKDDLKHVHFTFSIINLSVMSYHLSCEWCAMGPVKFRVPRRAVEFTARIKGKQTVSTIEFPLSAAAVVTLPYSTESTDSPLTRFSIEQVKQTEC